MTTNPDGTLVLSNDVFAAAKQLGKITIGD